MSDEERKKESIPSALLPAVPFFLMVRCIDLPGPGLEG